MRSPKCRQFLGPQYWPSDEQYGDHHPVFNRSVIATVHIHMPPETLKILRDPSYVYQNASYLPADMVFFNGNLELELPKIGIKCKGLLCLFWCVTKTGFSTRTYGKKSWKVDFSEFMPKRKVFKNNLKIPILSRCMD